MKFAIRLLLCIIVFASCQNNKPNKSAAQPTGNKITTAQDSLSVENNEVFLDTLPRGEFDGLWINLEYKNLIAEYRSYGKATEHYTNTDNFTAIISINREEIEILAPEGGDYNLGVLRGDTLNLLDIDYLITRISEDTIKLSRENISKLFAKAAIPLPPDYYSFLGQTYLGAFLLFDQKFKFIYPESKQSFEISLNKDFTITGHPRYVEYRFSTHYGKTVISFQEQNRRERVYCLFQEYDKGYLLQEITRYDWDMWLEFNNNRYYIAKQAPDGTFYNEKDIKDSDDVELVKSFLEWYKMNRDIIYEIDMIKGGYVSDGFDSYVSNGFYRVDMDECRKFLEMFKSTGYVSDKFINHWSDYFKYYEQHFKENEIDDGPPDGFDYDLILLTQEMVEALRTIPYLMKIEEIRRNDTNHSAIKVNLNSISLIFELSRNAEKKWQLDMILNGCCEENW